MDWKYKAFSMETAAAPFGNPALLWKAEYGICRECGNSIINIVGSKPGSKVPEIKKLVYPEHVNRLVPDEVGDPYRRDFLEACAVLPFSERASAALSRRCLQKILTDKGGAKERDLFDQIREVEGTLPPGMLDDLHKLRLIGNFSAHPIKDTNTGEILAVGPGEAEFCLDILGELFQHYFVKPIKDKEKRGKIDEWLKRAGRG
jgi:hypothetical protein